MTEQTNDLQLFLALYLRKGIDLTKHIMVYENNQIVIEYEAEDDFSCFDRNVQMVAKFDKEGKNIFLKYVNTLPIYE